MNAGNVEYNTGRYGEAVSLFSLAVERLSRLVADKSGPARYRDEYVTSLRALAIVQAVDQRYEEAWKTVKTVRDYLINDGCGDHALQTMEILHQYVASLAKNDPEAKELLDNIGAAIQALRAEQ
jgi:hypothetical protein